MAMPLAKPLTERGRSSDNKSHGMGPQPTEKKNRNRTRLTMASRAKCGLHGSSTYSAVVALSEGQIEGRVIKKCVPSIIDPKIIPVAQEIRRIFLPRTSTVKNEAMFPSRLATPTAAGAFGAAARR